MSRTVGAVLLLVALGPAGESATHAQATVSELLEASREATGRDPGQALELAERALALARAGGSPDDLARALNRVGVVHYQLGRYERALALYIDSARWAEEAHDLETTANALNNIGILYYFWGNLDQAIEHYRRTLDIRRRLGDPRGVAMALNNLGAVAHAAERHEEALDYFEHSIELYRELGDADRVASSHNNIGLALLAVGRSAEALARFDEALAMSRGTGALAEQAISHQNRGLALSHQGRTAEAREASLASLRLRRQLDDRAGMAMSLVNLGKIELAAGSPATAREALEDAGEIARELDIPEIQKEALATLSEALAALGDDAGALASFRAYHDVHARMLDEGSRRRLAEARARFEVEAQDAEIRRLERLRDTQRQVGWSLVLAIGLLLATTALLIGRIRQRSRIQRQMEEKNRELSAAHRDLQQASRTELAHLGRVVSLGELAAAVAHELNQPLASILTNAQLAGDLARRVESPSDLDEAIDDIALGARRAWDLLRHLRQLARPGEIERVLVDLRTIGDDAVELAAAEARLRGVELVVEWPEEPLRVAGNRIHLQQVLLNLLSNAVAAVSSGDGGDARSIRLRGRRGDDHALVEVEDDGPPVSDEVLGQMLQPFFTTKADGLGMGLAIARRLVEAHEGTLGLRRNGPRGLTATVTLPLA
jgi:C4-dicarboxylate-specific signal transduction histidine kinase